MLDQFNTELNSIIFEAYDVNPKFIDKDYQGTFNNVDLFTSKHFFSGVNKEMFLSPAFIQSILNKINVNEIKTQISIIVFIKKESLVFNGLIVPEHCKRYELILLNSWKSDKIPHLEVTGQKRIIL